MDINIRKVGEATVEVTFSDPTVSINSGLLSHNEQTELAELFVRHAEELLENVGGYGLQCDMLNIIYDSI